MEKEEKLKGECAMNKEKYLKLEILIANKLYKSETDQIKKLMYKGWLEKLVADYQSKL